MVSAKEVLCWNAGRIQLPIYRSDYAERERWFGRILRVNSNRRGITLGSALCVLCRYRHNTHWSEAKGRLNRQFGLRFGDRTYAFEELVAELAAAFMCSAFGITNEPRADHATYLASWLEILDNDARAIFTAASRAQEAIQFLGEVAASKLDEQCESEMA